jgi:hypothetical protein
MKAGQCVIPCIFVPVLFLFGNGHNILSLNGFVILFLSCSSSSALMIGDRAVKQAAFRIPPAADSPMPDPAS